MTSASSLIALLHEDDVEIQTYALEAINESISLIWAEMTPEIPYIESLVDDTSFSAQKLAALVVSKLYYYMDCLDDALAIALSADILAEPIQDNDKLYKQAVIATLIDAYVSNQRCVFKYEEAQFLLSKREEHQLAIDMDDNNLFDHDTDEELTPPEPADPRLASNFANIILQAAKTETPQAIGLCLDAHRLDLLETILLSVQSQADVMKYTLDCVYLIPNVSYRHSLLSLLTKLYLTPSSSPSLSSSPSRPLVDSLSMCSDIFGFATCLVLLEDVDTLHSTLTSLINSPHSHDHHLALQLAYQLYDSQQSSIQRLADLIKPLATDIDQHVTPPPASLPLSASDVTGVPSFQPPSSESGLKKISTAKPIASPSPILVEALKPYVPKPVNIATRVYHVLSGKTPQEVTNSYMYTHCRVDSGAITNKVKALDTRNHALLSLLASSVSLAYSGTQRDEQLKEIWPNFDKSLNWAKYTSNAAFGSIHRGDTQTIMKKLDRYLPNGSSYTNSSDSNVKYGESGALYALGLATAGYTDEHLDYLTTHLTSNPIVQHGASIGAGLAGVGSANLNTYEALREVILGDNDIAGEGAGYGIGSLYVGKANSEMDIVTELLAYLQSTPHEKTQRGLSVGLALMCLECGDSVDWIIQSLATHNNPVMRYGGMLAYGLAYIGTGNTTILSKLLSVGVSDGDDNVRRASVLSIAFIMLHEPHTLPPLLQSLSESYHVHVRYGVALALGIGCTGMYDNQQAVSILTSLLKDRDEFVVHGASIALAMVCMGRGQVQDKEVKEERARLTRVHRNIKNIFNIINNDGNTDTDAKSATPSLSEDLSTSSDTNLSSPSRKSDTDSTSTSTSTSTSKDGKDKKDEKEVKVKRPLDKSISLISSSKSTMFIGRVGAMLSQGILEGGGSNAIISMVNRHKQIQTVPVVGVVLFLQYWFWLPMAQCLSLAMTPNVFIGVDQYGVVPTNFKLAVGAAKEVLEYPNPFHGDVKPVNKVVDARNTLSQRIRKNNKDIRSIRKRKDTSITNDLDRKLTNMKNFEDISNITPLSIDGVDASLVSNPTRLPKIIANRVGVPQGQKYQPLLSEIGVGFHVLVPVQGYVDQDGDLEVDPLNPPVPEAVVEVETTTAAVEDEPMAEPEATETTPLTAGNILESSDQNTDSSN